MTSVDCDADTRATAQCNLAPFEGTYVCRNIASIFGTQIQSTVCARNIIQGFTLGAKADVCGCCAATGCPKTCDCPCGNNMDKVLVSAKVLFGLIDTKRCVTNGWSQHLQAWSSGSVSCIAGSSEQCLEWDTETEGETGDDWAAQEEVEAEDGSVVMPEDQVYGV